MLVRRLVYHQNAGQSCEMKVANRSFENVSQLKYSGITVGIKIWFRRKLRGE
jgi:hypothetical protein